MISNHFKVALRTLRKNKVYSAITLLGLTGGIVAVLLLFRLVSYELGFNKNFPKYDRIVRVVAEVRLPDGGLEHSVCTAIPAMDAMENAVSQFEAMSRVKEFWVTMAQPSPDGGPPVKKFNMGEGETAFFVEEDFFQIFDLHWLAGDPATAINQPNTIVLTERFAKKFFENDPLQAMGKELVMDNLVSVVVTGILADLPKNCDFNFPFLSGWETLKAYPDHFYFENNWGSCSSNNQVYALLDGPENLAAANASLEKIGAEEYKDRNGRKQRTHLLQPLSDLHYNEEYGHSGTHQVSKSRLDLLTWIGVLILIMACFNFINLATAQFALRAKEVGVRKTLGSGQSQLVWQFMSETGIIVALSVLIGANLALFASPLLKHVSDVPDELPFLGNPLVWGFLLVVGVVVTLLAGLYPSLALARYRPVEALRSKVSGGKTAGKPLRKSLVVVQFAIAQTLIIGAIVTLMQLDYIRSRDLGFAKDLVYNFGVGTDSSAQARHQILKQELLRIPSVEAVSLSSDQPLSGNTWTSNFRYATRPEDEEFGINLKFCDADYQKTYGLNLLAGRWFEPSDTTRQGVVNETLLRKLGVDDPAEMVGQNLFLGGRRPVQITGVVADFHSHSLHREMSPTLLTTNKAFYWDFGVKIRPGDVSGSVAAIQRSFDKIMPEQVFEGRFFDEQIARFYEGENRLSATCKAFGMLAILISCLGLFGLAAHDAQQRTKEIGIRKVLGATTANLVGLLSRDFLLLVLTALLVATPVAYFFLEEWLQGFAFRIGLTWWVFALSGGLAICIAFLTVGYQGLKAAIANPIRALKSE